MHRSVRRIEEMPTATQNQPIPRDLFENSVEYRALTDRQRIWVNTLLETQDPERATVTAYHSANSAYSKMLTHQIETNRRVIAALNAFYGRTEKEAFLLDLERTIQKTEGWAKVKAMSLYANLKFGAEEDSQPTAETEGSTDVAAQTFPIGAVIVQDGQKYRVTAQEIS
jgi:hypothetical protein